MKDTVIENKRLISYILTILSILTLIAGLSLIYYDYSLEQKAININAEIISINYENGVNKATVKYKVDKEVYQQTVKINDATLTVKDEVPIKYDMNNPGNLINNNHLIIYTPLIVISILLFIFTIGTTVKNIKRSSNIKFLTTKGIYVTANISELIVDTKGKMYKGKHPYRLRAKYINPTDNQLYTFDSENTYLDLAAITKKYNNQVVVVYLDKNNTSNYYVDLDSLFPHVKLVDVADIMGEKKNHQGSEQTEGAQVEKNEESNTNQDEEPKEENIQK